jgi:hypothetical protein
MLALSPRKKGRVANDATPVNVASVSQRNWGEVGVN